MRELKALKTFPDSNQAQKGTDRLEGTERNRLPWLGESFPSRIEEFVRHESSKRIGLP
jgi:hypothetical protein